MSIDEWAKRVVADIALEAGERAPADTAILNHLDEFETLAQRTRLKIPAFARALTRAGLTLRSGEPYTAETLRAQISRARARKKQDAQRDALKNLPTIVKTHQLTAPASSAPAPSKAAPGRMNLSMLEKMQQSKPRRPKLGSSED